MGRMKEIALVFGRLGVFGFGGPVATMAMMEEETTRKRQWLTRDEFSSIYAVCKLLPGPAATQMAIYLGSVYGGVRGGLLSGILFILPSFLMVLGLSYLYVAFGSGVGVSLAFSGMQAAALVVIFLSIRHLAKPYQKKRHAWMIALVSAITITLRPGLEPLVILFWGLAGAVIYHSREKLKARSFVPVLGFFLWPSAWAASTLADSSVLNQLFFMCLKAALFVFGTGLAVVPVLEADAVQHFHWLTHSEFMDGLAMGQITPGPVVITATFIGYKAAGWAGAVVATIGMFLPSFINVLFLVPRIWNRFSKTTAAQGFSAWAIPAVIGGILGTTLRLSWFTLSQPAIWAIFAASFLFAILKKPPAYILIPAAGIAGALVQILRTSGP